MSRTDVHRPHWVLMLDPTIRHWFTDEHNHEKGPCDLEQYISKKHIFWTPIQCYRNISGACPNLCGCYLCTGQPGRKRARRMERAAWRSIRQDLLKTLPDDREDMDVPPIHMEAWY